ncbi:MAG: DUF503 domain-containing protein [Nitrospirota bacterium]
MIIGSCTVTIHIPNSNSLKYKRYVLKSIIDRVKNRFNVSIAQIDTEDLWQKAILGIACVNTDSQHANETLSKVVNLIERGLTEGYIVDYGIEIL